MDLFFHRRCKDTGDDELQCVTLSGNFTEDYVGAVKGAYAKDGYVCVPPSQANKMAAKHMEKLRAVEKQSEEEDVRLAAEAAAEVVRLESAREDAIRFARAQLVERRDKLISLGKSEEEANLIVGL